MGRGRKWEGKGDGIGKRVWEGTLDPAVWEGRENSKERSLGWVVQALLFHFEHWVNVSKLYSCDAQHVSCMYNCLSNQQRLLQ